MITLKGTLTKAVVAFGLTFPQHSVAGEIGDRQVATMGMPASERIEVICEGRENSNLCQKLINEPVYRNLWLETADKLMRVEWFLAAKLVELNGEIDLQNESIQMMIERAPKLPDGRAVFRSEDGRYFDINGNLVSAEEAAAAR